MKLLSYDSPLFDFLNRLTDVMLVNLLYLLCCIPLVTYSAARCGLYSCAEKWNRKDTAGVREFFAAFRKNIRKGIGVSLLSILLIAAFVLDLVLLCSGAYDTGIFGKILLAIALVVVTAVSAQISFVFYKFDCPLPVYFSNAVLISLAHPLRTIFISVPGLIPWVVMIVFPELFLALFPVFLLLYFSLSAMAETAIMKKVYERLIMEHEERNAGEGRQLEARTEEAGEEAGERTGEEACGGAVEETDEGGQR